MREPGASVGYVHASRRSHTSTDPDPYSGPHEHSQAGREGFTADSHGDGYASTDAHADAGTDTYSHTAAYEHAAARADSYSHTAAYEHTDAGTDTHSHTGTYEHADAGADTYSHTFGPAWIRER